MYLACVCSGRKALKEKKEKETCLSLWNICKLALKLASQCKHVSLCVFGVLYVSNICLHCTHVFCVKNRRKGKRRLAFYISLLYLFILCGVCPCTHTPLHCALLEDMMSMAYVFVCYYICICCRDNVVEEEERTTCLAYMHLYAISNYSKFSWCYVNRKWKAHK